MAATKRLSKILHIREQEKHDAQKAYHHSQELFEDVAVKLYTLLRTKEAAEESYEGYLKQSTPITTIKEQLTYIEMLNKKIISMQQSVEQARNEMKTNQRHLTNAHVEVKKFEKIIEIRRREQDEIVRKNEKQAMDEIAIQQYLGRKNG
ncbi:hypothetical protein GCM10011409_04530 [Lentibacillus populi]|uniref:Flagellar FliJ protein n=1 Tax=Lentibacillus populi TaxID=1827502 RepID=A0A9W5TV10_9BACI|nr:flagellar export protein FliJ [Lentibacillus populi]GGB30296.1 hypothetical protein GCM10011409_04530 [Lentibacillus populi]